MRLDNIAVKELPAYATDESAEKLSCDACRNGEALDFDFSMAFQPLVDLQSKSVIGYESLVRGLNGEPAYTVINQVTAKNIYRFDQTCRVKAIALAAEANMDKILSINFMPGAIYKPEHCIRTTLKAAEKYGFPIEQISFEVVETDHIADLAHLQNIINHYNSMGFRTALDDFGSGYANLEWMARLSPNMIKVDMSLVRDIDKDKKQRVIVSHLYNLCQELGIDVLAEGIETRAERDCLADIGITKQQGYYFAKPQFEKFVEVDSALLT
ncbi:EAL domain-containing protein [Alteromonas antoniana]|uniref:EAL domain-containing protein n=1 Tax=Alteromonas antoniana TaxID=2803813 RepID=UPI001FE375B5|nr:EAL domain-containing protein [Alteromonas antoniana]